MRKNAGKIKAVKQGRIAMRVAALFLLLFLPACSGAGDAAKPAATPSAIEQTAEVATVSPSPVPYRAPSAADLPQAEPSFSFVDQIVCTAEEFVNIRESPQTEAPVCGKLPAGATAGVIAYEDEWANISYEGITGYVSKEYVAGISTPSIPVPAGEWAEILVNPAHSLPENYSAGPVDFEGGQVDERILEICTQMFRDAEEDGVSLSLVDAYRSYDRQNTLYQQKVESYVAKGYSREDAESVAATITVRPNTSEHQTGLALDIVTPSYTARDRGFDNTKAFAWLNANAQNYGFTLRYGEDKLSFTGVIYEPWHWRFVGTEAAIQMKESGECLEEYLNVTE